jgi:nucleoside-diphosphate-sugar epimerase
MARVLVTGATGFVGAVLCKQLADAGHSVSAALHRDREMPPHVDRKFVVGEIGLDTNWVESLRDVDCIVHAAARVHVMQPTIEDRQRFRNTNVLGTQSLLEAAVEGRIKRFIFLSSVKVNGEQTESRAFTSQDEPKPNDDYALSKWEAEKKLFEVAGSRLEAVAIRPTLVYGPGVKANFLRLMSWVDKGVPMPFGAIRNRRSMVSVWNLCDLIVRAVEVERLQSEVLLVSDGEDLSTPELVERIANAMGRRARLVSVPVALLRVLGKLTGKDAELSRLCGSLQVDISATKQHLNWSPPVSVSEGLARTADWYLREASSLRG